MEEVKTYSLPCVTARELERVTRSLETGDQATTFPGSSVSSASVRPLTQKYAIADGCMELFERNCHKLFSYRQIFSFENKSSYRGKNLPKKRHILHHNERCGSNPFREALSNRNTPARV